MCKSLYNELLEYKDGELYHKVRDRKHFIRECRWTHFNENFAGRIATTVSYTSLGYRRKDVKIKGKTHLASRVIYVMHYGSIPKNFDIDHINRDSTDNKIENLRAVPHCLNMRNQTKRNTNKSGKQGVCLHKPTGKWRAYIMVNGVHRHLGLFKNKDEAIDARIKAENQFGFIGD